MQNENQPEAVTPEVTDFNPDDNSEFTSVAELTGKDPEPNAEPKPEMTENPQQSESEQQSVNETPEVFAITTYDPAEVNIDDFDFNADLDALEQQVKRAERIVVVDHADGSGGKTNFLLRALTPAEEASLNQNVLSEADMTKIVETLMKNAESDGKLETDDITQMIAEKLSRDDTTEASNQRFLRKIQKGIAKPQGITIERLERWNPALLERFFDVIEELTFENEKWILSRSN